MSQHLSVVVRYPLDRGEIRLRAEPDWDRDLLPSRRQLEQDRFEFEIDAERPHLAFKPVLHKDGGLAWAQGPNRLAVLGSGPAVETVYPHFDEDAACSVCELTEFPQQDGRGPYRARVFYPPGYAENTLERYPVLYMQDGQNLFFPGEAFGGHHWRIGETLERLDDMSLIRKALVVGVYPRERMADYTRPGYDAYARFLVEELKPWVDRSFRTLTGPEHTAVLGSSLGGVVSFYLGWQHPEVFGLAGAMSSTFGRHDDLLERVAREPRRSGRIYLDSGWPGDNYEVTRAMRRLLIERGYAEGKDLLYFAFPEALHDERHWAMRAHLPFQWFFGKEDVR